MYSFDLNAFVQIQQLKFNDFEMFVHFVKFMTRHLLMSSHMVSVKNILPRVVRAKTAGHTKSQTWGATFLVNNQDKNQLNHEM